MKKLWKIVEIASHPPPSEKRHPQPPLFSCTLNSISRVAEFYPQSDVPRDFHYLS